MPITIFVSSTFADLERHRSLVRDAITRLEHASKAMEFFGALPESPKQECLRLVRASNVYVGIFGMRYGFVDASSGKSLTQLEYEEAQAIRLPSLVYLMDEDLHLLPPKHVEAGESALKLLDFKKTLKKNHVVNFFSSPEDLTAKVTQDLVKLLGAIERTPNAQVLSQIAVNSVLRHPLTEPRYNFLKGKIDRIFTPPPPDAILREALELIIGGDKMAAAFVLSRGTPMGMDEAVDGLMAIEKMLNGILENSSKANSKDV
ncbi:MAG: DUF4062 domain-containing protein [Pseudomonadales bacterium]